MSRGGLAIALLAAILSALLFYSAAQSITQQFARIRPAISEGEFGPASKGWGDDLNGRRVRTRHAELVTSHNHDAAAITL